MAEEKKEEVFITAASGSRRFDKVVDSLDSERGIVGYNIVANIDGREQRESLGDFPKQKYPGTKQGKKPWFDSDSGQYILRRSDGSIWTKTDLDKFVKEMSLTYPKTNPRYGQPITESNLKNFGDAFINHPMFVKFLEEGEGSLNPTLIKDKFQEDFLRGQRSFMDESLDNIRSGDVEYIIRDPKVTEKREEQGREEEELAYEYYNGMKTDPERMRMILGLFYVDMAPESSVSSLRTAVHKKMKDTVGREMGELNQKLFIRFSEYLPDVLKLRYLVSLANMKKLIYDRAGTYEFDGTPVGETFDGVCDFFRRSENGGALSAIKNRLNIKD